MRGLAQALHIKIVLKLNRLKRREYYICSAYLQQFCSITILKLLLELKTKKLLLELFSVWNPIVSNIQTESNKLASK